MRAVTMFLHKSHIWEISDSWNIGQNAFCQSDYTIFKSTLSLEENDEKAWFFACCYRQIEIKSWLKNIEVGTVKTGCGHYGPSTLEPAVSQEGI